MRARRSSQLAAALSAAAATLALAGPAAAEVAFMPPAFFPAGAETGEVAVGDFNRDGLLDAATANRDAANASVLLGDGHGALGAPATYAVGGAPQDIATGDFNRDTFLDLAVADQQGHVAVLQGVGNGAFGAARIVQTSGSASRVAVGDVNGDSFADLASADTTAVPGDVSIELGDGAGGFGAALPQEARGAPVELALRDLNGDGRADAITSDGGMK